MLHKIQGFDVKNASFKKYLLEMTIFDKLKFGTTE
jgi:hypothetical protein